ncbi:hypothetical protein SLOPH_1192 [Spraguea lophii 42_110]|uniref:Hpc2-related domain-containing protein n=1 Tax=Spraguea lophii (strain 42_110) TaxID=1358809 RepID=S7W6D9_SPRLO|nr:hypothetical protein SLOPH_1192 [Spraguea lophii 42_110]
MFNKEIPIDIMSSTEINFVANIQKRPRRSKEDYDAEDSFVDNLEGEDEMVYIECTMDDFFVYSGTLPTTAKRVAKKYKKREERKSKDKEDKNTKEEKKEKDDINNKTDV